MEIHESGEDYLEQILMLSEKQGQVRSIDIATSMGVSKPSVSNAMKKLRLGGLIRVDGDGFITLTDGGMEIAAKIYERHRVLAAVLISLGVDEDTAFEDACKIEHDISEDSFRRIQQHYRAHIADPGDSPRE